MSKNRILYAITYPAIAICFSSCELMKSIPARVTLSYEAEVAGHTILLAQTGKDIVLAAKRVRAQK